MKNKYNNSPHTFHIPVMGTAFTIDSPIKLARFGIDSVVSICDDELCETMRKHYAGVYKLPFSPVDENDVELRAKRITAYLDLMQDILDKQIDSMKASSFDKENDLVKYFELLPEKSSLKEQYKAMCNEKNEKKKSVLQQGLKEGVVPGAIDVNIMTKVDRDTRDKENTPLPSEFSDACAGVRGFANSKIHSSVILSAGFNRRLFAYMENLEGFYPDKAGHIAKKIILKVTDFRSSLTQGKFFAKKGLWVSEYRVESGLNCGGHAFASDGLILGKILQEFKEKREELESSLLEICNDTLSKKERAIFKEKPMCRLTVQGGIGTHNEDNFLQEQFNCDGTGWATPFLLVPEATTLDMGTRDMLVKATEDDTYLSEISPLGIPFNTIKNTYSEQQKLERVEGDKPGSPCPKGFLKLYNTEFTKVPVCTASVTYQRRKIKQLKSLGLKVEEYKEKFSAIINKACLCEDLAAGALIINKLKNNRPLATAICPGPNIAYFSKLVSLKDMISHIYGRLNIMEDIKRPNMFIKELTMYKDHFVKEVKAVVDTQNTKQIKSLKVFKENLYQGMEFYKDSLIPTLVKETQEYRDVMSDQLAEIKAEIDLFLESIKDSVNFEPLLEGSMA